MISSFSLLFIILITLILLGAFFSAAETSFMAVNPARIYKKGKSKEIELDLIKKLLLRPDKLLGATLIGNTLTNILASSYTTIIAEKLFGNLGIMIATLLLSIVIVLFSEIAPKTLAATYPEKVVWFTVKPLYIFMKFFHPAIWLINSIINNLLALGGVEVKEQSNKTKISREELKILLSSAEQLVSQKNREMFIRILELEDLTVNDIMIPKEEIFAIDVNKSWSEIVSQLQKTKYRRIIAYKGELKNILGILDLKKVWLQLLQGEWAYEDLLSSLEDINFIPEGTSIGKQLINFQQQKINLGIVVDEYGEIVGMLTLNNILEEIVGDFCSDSINEEEHIIKESIDQSYEVSGSILIRDLNKALSCELPIDGPKTLSGLIIENLESIPDKPVCLRIIGHAIEIVSIKNNKIELAKIIPKLYLEPITEETDK